MKPTLPPIGLVLAQTAKSCGRAFEDALAQAGGTTPAWLILTALMQGGHRTQADLAAAVNVQGPTLTHHLNGMEKEGLIVRSRLPDNRRAHQVALTDAGRAAFHRLKDAAITHDARVRAGFTAAELQTLRELLLRLGRNVPDTQV